MDQYTHRVERPFDLYGQADGGTAPRVRTAMGFDEEASSLLLGELNHRMRNFLAMIEAFVALTQSTTVEDYRAKLITRLSGIRGVCEVIGRADGRMVALAELLEQTIRSCWVKGARVLAAGPDIDVEPRLALALHLVLHELATNANKYGALSSAAGCVQVHWTIRHVAGAVPKLAIVWTEHGGPEVKQPRHRGFGSRLIKKALQGYGAVRVKFKPAGLVCVMLVDLSAKRGRAPFSSVHYEADSTINHNGEWSG